ncbi:MAG TPA: urease accessory UreF family protein [Nitrososphaera sp.]|nr:urease accessory UreF family protein [Nitrososphaera sp.]
MNEHEFHLMQLADSFFPSGMFGLSGGMESFVKSGRVKNGNDVLRFIRQQIKFQIVPCDCAVLSAVMKAAKKGDIAGVVAADNRCYSIKLVQEVRVASSRSGRQLLSTLAHMANDKFAKKFYAKVEAKESAGTYPACLAVAAGALRIPEKSALRMMLYSYCVSIVGSAVRLAVISHIEGQSILTQLARDVNSAKPARNTANLWQLAPLAEILQMQHEQDDSRMFIT